MPRHRMGRKLMLSTAGVAPGGGGGAAAGEMLITAARLATLPSSGTPWDYMKAQADDALMFVNTSATTGTAADRPWLPNYNSSNAAKRIGPMILACALVYARIGGAGYKTKVEDACRFLIGTETQASTSGQSTAEAPLATMRQLPSFILAADLVGMDRNLTGTRTGWTSTSWESWLATLPNKTIGTSGAGTTIVSFNNNYAHNWGTWASASRMALAIYLNDTPEFVATLAKFKRYLGDRSAASAFLHTDTSLGGFDPTWVCLEPPYTDPQTDWVPINPSYCGSGKDGAIVEDASRSTGSYPTTDATGIAYIFEAYQAMLLVAIMLDQQGYDPWSWSSNALKRAGDWIARGSHWPTTTARDWTEMHVAWVANYYLNPTTPYPQIAAKQGRSLAFTDWLYP